MNKFHENHAYCKKSIESVLSCFLAPYNGSGGIYKDFHF